MGPSTLQSGGEETNQESELYNRGKYKYLNGYAPVILRKLSGSQCDLGAGYHTRS